MQASVRPTHANFGEVVTYTVALLGSGQAMTLTNNLPASVSAPKSLQATSGNVSYDAGQRRVQWTGALTAGTSATITFPVDVLIAARQAVSNTVQVVDAASGTSTSSTAVFIANGYEVYLPLIRR
jgi:hypothetical protein